MGVTEDRLPRRLRALPRYLMRAVTREGYQRGVDSKVAMDMTQYAVLAVIDPLGLRSQRAITELIGFDKRDVTLVVNELQSRDLVQRREDREDAHR